MCTGWGIFTYTEARLAFTNLRHLWCLCNVWSMLSAVRSILLHGSENMAYDGWQKILQTVGVWTLMSSYYYWARKEVLLLIPRLAAAYFVTVLTQLNRNWIWIGEGSLDICYALPQIESFLKRCPPRPSDWRVGQDDKPLASVEELQNPNQWAVWVDQVTLWSCDPQIPSTLGDVLRCSCQWHFCVGNIFTSLYFFLMISQLSLLFAAAKYQSKPGCCKANSCKN